MGLSHLTSFWSDTGRQVGILKDQHESDLQFCTRVMFSVVSAWVLIKISGQANSTSVESVRQTIREKCVLYSKLLPVDHGVDADALMEMIYQTLLDNGVFYHSQYKVHSVPYRLIGFGEVSLVRGFSTERKLKYSGLAPFIREASGEANLVEDFILWPYDGETTISLVWKRSKRVDHSISFEEYLNLERTRGQYYSSYRNKSWPFALARNKQPGNAYNFDYYIIIENEVRHIPTDFVNNSIHDYVRLAMMNRVKPQIISASISDQIISIDCGYILPAPDLRLIRYVSWPPDIDDPMNAFRFIMHCDLWPIIKNRFESLGYEVKEKND